MNKGIVSLFIIFVFVFCSSNKPFEHNKFVQNDDKILWSSDRKLKWEDFRGTVDTTNSKVVASTFSEIEVVKSYFKNGLPKYIVESHFIKSKSWTNSSDDYVLSHEQLHFDISELFKRKIAKSFDSLNAKKIKDYKVYSNTYINFCEKSNRYQDLYDSQVYFDSIKQKQWIEKISNELDKLKTYQ